MLLSVSKEIDEMWACNWLCLRKYLPENLETNLAINMLNGERIITPTANIQFTINIMMMVMMTEKIP